MNTHTIIRNLCVISAAFLLANAAYAVKPTAASKATLGGLACNDGQIAEYDEANSVWICATQSTGGGSTPQFEVQDHSSAPIAVGTFVGFSGPNIAQVLINESSSVYLLEVNSEGFMAHPRVNFNPDYVSSDSRRPVIYYYENNDCNATATNAVYTNPDNFLPPFGGGFAPVLSDSNGYVVVLENGAANLYTTTTTPTADPAFLSVRYMGRCINNYGVTVDEKSGATAPTPDDETNLATLDANDFNDLPNDMDLTIDLLTGVTTCFNSNSNSCIATGVVQLVNPVDLHAPFNLPFTLQTVTP